MKNVLFVCVHNAGRSQMAETFFNEFVKGENLDIVGLSAGTVPGSQINPTAQAAMTEIGLSMETNTPKELTQEMVDNSLKVITMGCGVDAAACPARIHISEDWGLDDPAGQGIEEVRRIRDQIRDKTKQLVQELARQ